MDASKEECRKHITTASILVEMMGEWGDQAGLEAAQRLCDFLQAAEKRLPSREAIERDKARRRKNQKALHQPPA